MKTRIDVIAGYAGAGKTALIDRMLRAETAGGPVSVCADTGRDTFARLARMVRRDRPARVLLETAALPEDIDRLFLSDDLPRLAYPGTRACVLDGSAFLAMPEGLRAYCERQIRSAGIVFVNRADALSAEDRLVVLARIWEINRHVQLMVAPEGGIDLWKVFDLPRGMDA